MVFLCEVLEGHNFRCLCDSLDVSDFVEMSRYLEQIHGGTSLITLLVHSSGLRSWLRGLPQASYYHELDVVR